MKLKIPQATSKGYIEIEPGGVFDAAYPNSKTRRGRVQGGVRYARLSCATANCYFTKVMKTFDILAVGRERTEEEKLRRHLHGDKGAKFSKGKRLCLLGHISGCITTMATKDNLICEIYE